MDIDVLAHIARGHGRDHQLPHADGKRSHRRRDDCGAARPARPDNAADVTARCNKVGECDRYRGHYDVPVADIERGVTSRRMECCYRSR